MKYFTPFSVDSKMFETVHSKTQTCDIIQLELFGSQLSSNHIYILDGKWEQKFVTSKCWRMLETKCVGGYYMMFVTVLAILVTTLFLHKRVPTFKRCYQHRNSLANIRKLSPTSLSADNWPHKESGKVFKKSMWFFHYFERVAKVHLIWWKNLNRIVAMN